MKKGKTPVPNADEARELLDAIDTGSLVGLRDRALIGLRNGIGRPRYAGSVRNILNSLLPGEEPHREPFIFLQEHRGRSIVLKHALHDFAGHSLWKSKMNQYLSLRTVAAGGSPRLEDSPLFSLNVFGRDSQFHINFDATRLRAQLVRNQLLDGDHL